MAASSSISIDSFENNDPSDLHIYYGALKTLLDITDKVKSLAVDSIIIIPSYDQERADIFTDPLFGTLKYILITYKNNKYYILAGNMISINLNDIASSLVSYTINNIKKISVDQDFPTPINKLNALHNQITFYGGNIKDELPEQIMAVMHIQPSHKVLELGSNIGRNTLVIASLLEDSHNLVTLECDPDSAAILEINKEINNLSFSIEVSALSKKKLIQKGWDTIPSEILLEGYTSVNIINYDELMAKYNIPFNVIVADCEGALYYILQDMPEVLTNIEYIIMENDYRILGHKEYVNNILTTNNFKTIFSRGGGWGPCTSFFFEVWKRD